LADAIGPTRRWLARLAEGVGVRRATGLLSGLAERVVGRARLSLRLVGGRVVNELPFVVFRTLTINLDAGPFECAGDAGNPDRRCVLRATTGRLIGAKELIVNGGYSRIRGNARTGGLGLRQWLLRKPLL